MFHHLQLLPISRQVSFLDFVEREREGRRGEEGKNEEMMERHSKRVTHIAPEHIAGISGDVSC